MALCAPARTCSTLCGIAGFRHPRFSVSGSTVCDYVYDTLLSRCWRWCACIAWQDLAALQAKVQEVTDLKARDAQVSADALKQLRTASDAAEKVSLLHLLGRRALRTSFVVGDFLTAHVVVVHASPTLSFPSLHAPLSLFDGLMGVDCHYAASRCVRVLGDGAVHGGLNAP